MDFLDPKKMRRDNIMLIVGYSLAAVAILFATMVLLYQSYGFGINKNGDVIQNGLVFTASTPSSADIYINGENSGFQTNKRLVLAAGRYVLQLKKQGYRSWTRSIEVDGGSVNRYDYSFLFPTTLEPSVMQNFDAAPTIATQSPDRRWLLVQVAGDTRSFEVFDLKNPTLSPKTITLPASVVTTGTNEGWQLVEWSNDNVHVLLKHTYDTNSEFVLLNRTNPDQSLNLNATLGVTPTQINLSNKKYDHYYVFDQTAKTLKTANLSNPTPADYLTGVLAYKSYGDNTMLYVTDEDEIATAAQPQVSVKLDQGGQTYIIRKMTPGTQYLLEIASYSGDLYVVAGSNVEDKVLVYKNPVDQISNQDIGVAVQVATLRVDDPSFVSFSNNTRFIMAENGASFAVYDAETDQPYTYSFSEQLDAPQTHASWMDGSRLQYVSGGKLFVFDYDHTNRQTLVSAAAQYLPAYRPDYKQLFVLSPQPSDASRYSLTSTWLLTAADR